MAQATNRPLAVVTGASTGIGFELARQFAGNGYDLLVTADEARIHEAAAELGGDGTAVHAVQADLTTFDGVEQLYAEIKGMGRPVAAVAINAGVGVNGDFARETSLAEELNMIQLNVTSVVHLAKRVVGDMVDRNEGKVLFTGSIVSTTPNPLMAVYAATKAFILSFSEAIRNELKDTNITVTTLMPGATETEFFRRANMEDTRVGQGKKDDAALVAKQGFEALMEGKDKVVAGSLKVKLQGIANEILPEPTKAAAARKQAEPADPKS